MSDLTAGMVCTCGTNSDDYSDHTYPKGSNERCPVWHAGRKARLAREASLSADERFADVERGEVGSYKDSYVRSLELKINDFQQQESEWITYCEAEPQTEPLLSMAKFMRSQSARITELENKVIQLEDIAKSRQEVIDTATAVIARASARIAELEINARTIDDLQQGASLAVDRIAELQGLNDNLTDTVGRLSADNQRLRAIHETPDALTECDEFNAVVDRFVVEMKAKFRCKYDEGHRGWNNPNCYAGMRTALLEHAKRSLQHVDVANFAAMLWALGDPRTDKGAATP